MWQRLAPRLLISALMALVSIAAWAGPLAPAALAAPSEIIIVTTCDESALQGAIAQATPGETYTVQYRETDCVIAITDPLALPPGVNITIDGNGLTLNGQQSQLGIFDIQNDQGTTSLALDDVTIADGNIGVSLVPTMPGTGAQSGADSWCWIGVSQLGAGGSAQLTGCQAAGQPGSTGFSLTCRKQSIADSNKNWSICFGTGQTSSGGQAVYAATSLLGPGDGNVVLSTHFRYATYSWARATARCGFVLRRGIEPSLTVTCQAN